MASNMNDYRNKANLGISHPDGIIDPITNLRMNKRGQLQFSIDKGFSWKNLKDDDVWVNLYVGPLDDVDGDGSSDNILSRLQSLQTAVDDLDISSVTQEEFDALNGVVDNINERLESIEEVDVEPIPYDDIINIFG